MSLDAQPQAYYEQMKTEYHYKSYSATKVNHCYVKTNDGKYIQQSIERILDKDKSKIIGQKVVDYSFFRGNADWAYIGDPRALGKGFFGLLIDSGEKKEWLVVTLSAAASFHCLLDSNWIETSYVNIDKFGYKGKPWFIQGRGLSIQEDNFTSFIKGCVISDIDLKPESCKIILEKNGQKHTLEILNTDPRLCPWPGAEYKVGKEKRYAIPKAFQEGTDHIGNYIIFMEEEGSIYV